MAGLGSCCILRQSSMTFFSAFRSCPTQPCHSWTFWTYVFCKTFSILSPVFWSCSFFPRQKVAFKKNLRRCTRLGHFSFRPSLCFFQLGEFLGHSHQRLALVAGLKLPGDGEVEACRCQVLLLLFGRCHYGQLWSNWLAWTFQLTNVLALLMLFKLFKWKSLY